ncbi:MAG TPA: hypothetical protein VLE89_01435 [Chlamydiales bacterium]|nr:hypothetical protein [Chlamydiales bacterium]
MTKIGDTIAIPIQGGQTPVEIGRDRNGRSWVVRTGMWCAAALLAITALVAVVATLRDPRTREVGGFLLLIGGVCYCTSGDFFALGH